MRSDKYVKTDNISNVEAVTAFFRLDLFVKNPTKNKSQMWYKFFIILTPLFEKKVLYQQKAKNESFYSLHSESILI